MAVIQWYPGHMAKALREVNERLSLVDIVLELVDARIPYSSANPKLSELLHDKLSIKILMKSDLADEKITNEWLNYYAKNNQLAVSFSAYKKNDLQKLIHTIHQATETLNEKRISKGMKPRPVRALIVGIPNVGKSTLINRLAGKKVAAAGNRPGVTKAQQWIKYKKEFELLDTPGILWPKFEDFETGKNLAVTGAIKDQLLHLDDIALYAIAFLVEHYPHILEKRYQLEQNSESALSTVDLLLAITEKRGFFDDYERGSQMLLKELRDGILGAISFERPTDERI
ncbi:ribosome biogenesis GTPase YlqF [Allofustis seminis]|uniref:ribosome biogenesis GTPase YlqF n=1 Tax=Allofustis seminis TaxID=166939 RepID=UPI00037191DE|nr:ribosome biogenesis GTPase YlqF [Allofustis seminis]